VDLLQEFLLKMIPAGWRARVQSAITLSDSEPEPDLAIVPGPASRYHDHHPSAADVGLVVEVADTSLRQDRVLKNLIYSRASIPVYWIVNLIDRQIEAYTQPSGPVEEPRYAERQDYRSGDSAPVVLDGQLIGSIAVEDLLP
jgi:Uma2 family endonuclease